MAISINWSIQIIAHVTTAMLSWHLQKLVAISQEWMNHREALFPSNSNYDGKALMEWLAGCIQTECYTNSSSKHSRSCRCIYLLALYGSFLNNSSDSFYMFYKTGTRVRWKLLFISFSYRMRRDAMARFHWWHSYRSARLQAGRLLDQGRIDPH